MGSEQADGSGVESKEDPLSGTPYCSTKLLGQGGTAEVYEARPRKGGHRVAVKILRPRLVASEEAVERMRIEAETLLCINHPNVVRVLDFARTSDGRPYLVEERLYGRTVHREIRKRGPIPVLESLDWIAQLLAGLEIVHRLGVVHRDLKLANLFLGRHKRSQTRALKLVDFGFAKVLRGAGTEWRPRPLAVSTAPDKFVGTPRYAAPEQVDADREISPAADLYTVGLVLYSLLAGREPFAEIDRETDLLLAQIEKELDSPAKHAAEPVAVELERLLRKAVAKNPQERFGSAAEMRQELSLMAHRLRAPVGWALTQMLPDSKLLSLVDREANRSRRGTPLLEDSTVVRKPDRSSRAPTAHPGTEGRPITTVVVPLPATGADAHSETGGRPLSAVAVPLAAAGAAALAPAEQSPPRVPAPRPPIWAFVGVGVVLAIGAALWLVSAGAGVR